MRLHRLLTLSVLWAVGSLLVVGCTGSSADEQSIQPLPSAEQASEEADAGSVEPDGVVAESADGDSSGADDDVEVEQSDDGVAATGAGPAEDDGVDVTVIPDVITEEYVEAVLAELEQLYADALRELMIAGEPTIEVTDRLGSAFSEPQYQARLDEMIDLIATSPDVLAEPQNLRPRTHEVVSLLRVEQACLFVETIADGSGVTRRPLERTASFVVLKHPDVERPGNRNRTQWVIHSLPLGDFETLRESDPCLS